MGRVALRSYLSPTLVLLAFDWPEGGNHPDFVGFCIRRSCGFLRKRRRRKEGISLPLPTLAHAIGMSALSLEWDWVPGDTPAIPDVRSGNIGQVSGMRPA
jgi:hypothetical protein